MTNDVKTVIDKQRRKRRTAFGAGLVVLLVVGGLWAGLSREPLNPFDGFDDRFDVIVDGPFPVEAFPAIDEAFPVEAFPPPIPPPPIPFPEPIPVPTPTPPPPDDGN